MKKILLILNICLTTLAFAQNPNVSEASSPLCDSLNTIYGYTYLNHGAMFDVVAKTNNISLDHLTANIKNGTISYSIYYKTGSFVGFEQQPSAWTLIDSALVTSNNTLTINNLPTEIPINLNLTLNLGDTVAFYLVQPVLSKVYLTSTTIPWATEYVSDSVLSISVARSVYQLFNVPFSTPQIWNGTVGYCIPGTVGLTEHGNAADAISLSQLSGEISVQIPQELLDHAHQLELTIVDMLSRSVVHYNVNAASFSINTNNFSNGMYVCLVTDKSGILKQQKIVIR
ncbi:MAG TPA: T9SS type A sorting domain-containing protein [Bacteroidia bacterium]|nr:T9SS type A sorting domain-containing protein [Bacteroidia bacterium]